MRPTIQAGFMSSISLLQGTDERNRLPDLFLGQDPLPGNHRCSRLAFADTPEEVIVSGSFLKDSQVLRLWIQRPTRHSITMTLRTMTRPAIGCKNLGTLGCCIRSQWIGLPGIF